MTAAELLFEQWLDEIRPVVPLGDEGISNRERYSDIIDPLSKHLRLDLTPNINLNKIRKEK